MGNEDKTIQTLQRYNKLVELEPMTTENESRVPTQQSCSYKHEDMFSHDNTSAPDKKG